MGPIWLAGIMALCGSTLMAPWAVALERNGLTPRIINGAPADITEYPFLVSIQEKYQGSFYHRCGGTFLAANKILTAAHCVLAEDGTLFNTEDLQVVSGLTRPDQSLSRVSQIRSLKVHPKFRYPPYFDVAVITLEKEVESFTPISLALSGPKAKTEGVVVGWGSVDDYGGTKSRELLAGGVSVSSDSQCRRRLNKFSRGHPTVVFCATKNPSDICDGDSGGPLLMRVDGGFVQAGITSAVLDDHCASPSGSAFTKLSAKQIKDFIGANR